MSHARWQRGARKVGRSRKVRRIVEPPWRGLNRRRLREKTEELGRWVESNGSRSPRVGEARSNYTTFGPYEEEMMGLGAVLPGRFEEDA